MERRRKVTCRSKAGLNQEPSPMAGLLPSHLGEHRHLPSHLKGHYRPESHSSVQAGQVVATPTVVAGRIRILRAGVGRQHDVRMLFWIRIDGYGALSIGRELQLLSRANQGLAS